MKQPAFLVVDPTAWNVQPVAILNCFLHGPRIESIAAVHVMDEVAPRRPHVLDSSNCILQIPSYRRNNLYLTYRIKSFQHIRPISPNYTKNQILEASSTIHTSQTATLRLPNNQKETLPIQPNHHTNPNIPTLFSSKLKFTDTGRPEEPNSDSLWCYPSPIISIRPFFFFFGLRRSVLFMGHLVA